MHRTAVRSLGLAWINADRELLSHRANRFVHWHLGLLLATGVFAVLIAPASAERGVMWFILSGVLYVLSLSSLLLGLSSAQAEAEELPFLATQPMGLGPWLFGKVLGLGLIVLPASVILVLPWFVTHGWSESLLVLAVAAGGVCVTFALLGLAVGLWVRDQVRGLICALAIWFVLLFGVDLIALLAAGSPWARQNPGYWAVPLMLNPLDAFRIAVTLTVERAVFNSLGAGPVVTWWTEHTRLWLGLCLAGWCLGLWGVARRALRRIRRAN